MLWTMRKGTQSNAHFHISIIILNILLIVVYICTVMFSLRVENLILIIILLELIRWLFSRWLRLLRFKYLFLQRYFFVIAFIRALAKREIIVWAFFLKMGLPPFHTWFFALCSSMKRYTFVFFSTVHKIVPLALISTISLLFSLTIGIVTIVFLLGAVLIIQSHSFWSILIRSSYIHSCWMFFSMKINSKLFFFYWLLYRSIVLAIILRTFSRKVIFIEINQNSLSLFLWLVLSGLPPFLFFWLKVNIVRELVQGRIISSFIILFSAVASISAYYRIFHLRLSLSTFKIRTSIFFVSVVLSRLLWL